MLTFAKITTSLLIFCSATFSQTGFWQIMATPVTTAHIPFYRTITIDHTKCGSTDSNNFPVLVAGTYSFLATAANGGHVQNASGYDVVFTLDQAGTQRLKWEIESYNPVTGSVVYWVNLPTVSHTTNTVFYMFYGDGTITSDQSNKGGTWDSYYAAVYHSNSLLNAAPQIADSTSHGLGITTVGSESVVTGKIGSAVRFANANQYGSSTGYTSANSGVGSIANTISGWVYFNTFFSYDPGATTFLGTGSATYPYNVNSFEINNSQRIVYVTANGSTGGSAVTTGQSGSLSLNTWYYIVGTYDGSTLSLYLNGTLVSSVTRLGSPGDAPIGFVGVTGLGNSRVSDLSLDEVRFSSVARSASWITAEYNNENSPSTFYSVGPEIAGH